MGYRESWNECKEQRGQRTAYSSSLLSYAQVYRIHSTAQGCSGVLKLPPYRKHEVEGYCHSIRDVVEFEVPGFPVISAYDNRI